MVTFNLSAAIIVVLAALPTGAVTLGVYFIQRSIEKRDKKQESERQARQQEVDRRDQQRQDNEFMTLKCVMASLDLAEATAKAVQRIPDAHCNGDMTQALEKAAKVRQQQEEFVERAGISSIYQNQPTA